MPDVIHWGTYMANGAEYAATAGRRKQHGGKGSPEALGLNIRCFGSWGLIPSASRCCRQWCESMETESDAGRWNSDVSFPKGYGGFTHTLVNTGSSSVERWLLER